MFEMTREELENWRFQFGTSNSAKMGLRVQPFVILAKLRSFLLLEREINDHMDKFEAGTNKVFQVVFERLDNIEEVIVPKLSPKRKKIGLK